MRTIFEVNVPGGRIVGEATGNGAAVLLLHAGVADRRMWNSIVPALSADYLTVRFDFRGFGESPPSTEPYRTADDVGAVLDALDIPAAHLVGASMGGTAAMEFALAAPDRALSLSLLATGLPGHDYGQEMIGYFTAEEDALGRGDIEAVVDLNLDVWVRGTGRGWSDRTRSVADELRDPLRIIASNQAEMEDLEEEADLPARENLERLVLPTLVVIAESDPADLVAIGELVAARIPGARTVRMPDTAHLPALERPAETIAALTEFLALQQKTQGTNTRA